MKELKRKQVGLHLNSDPLPGPNTRFWGIKHNEVEVGKVTSAVYSPRLKENIGLAMVLIEFSDMGQKLIVNTPDGDIEAMVVEKPFFDPKKKITTQN
jgi:aminomethyltransferase